MEERLNELEMRFMLQQNTLDDLNDIVCHQEQTILRLEREITRLKEQVQMALPGLTVSAEDDEPPPHY